MSEILETLMILCFGLSWPISVYKSVKSKSTKGKSLVFMLAILVGYISGIVGKIVGGKMNYVLVIYCINLVVVSTDVVLYFVNKKREENEKQVCTCNDVKEKKTVNA